MQFQDKMSHLQKSHIADWSDTNIQDTVTTLSDHQHYQGQERIISTNRLRALAVLKLSPLQMRRNQCAWLIRGYFTHPGLLVSVCQGRRWIHYCEIVAPLQHYSQTKLNHMYLLTDKRFRIQRAAVAEVVSKYKKTTILIFRRASWSKVGEWNQFTFQNSFPISHLSTALLIFSTHAYWIQQGLRLSVKDFVY